MTACEQGCGATAEVYAIDPIPGGWGGRYCRSCATALLFQVVDVLRPPTVQECPSCGTHVHTPGGVLPACPKVYS